VELARASSSQQRRPTRTWLVALGLIVLVAAGGAVYRFGPIGQRAAPPSYLTATVVRGDMATQVSAAGPIAAAASVSLSFKSPGRITSLAVRPGDRVKAGQILATESTTDLQAALDGARATLDQAQANLATLEAGPGDAQRSAADSPVQAARAAVEDAAANLDVTRESTTADVAVADAGVTTAGTNVVVAGVALAGAKDQSAKALALDQTAVANAEKALAAQQAAATVAVKVAQVQLAKSKDDLWAAQTNRDGICGQGKGFACSAADASVGAAQTAVDTAAAQLEQAQKESAQQVVTAQGALDQARAQLASDDANRAMTVATAEGQLRQAGDALTAARRTAASARARARVTDQAARAQVDQSAGALTSAQAAYRVAVATPTEVNLAAARSQVAGARAAVDSAQANLDAATLRAPFDGMVASVDGAVGEWVGGGGSGSSGGWIIQVLDLGQLTVVAQVNEADVAGVDVGNPVTFTLNAFPGQTFTGRVTAFQPRGQSAQNVVTYAVTSTIDSTPIRLLPGMTASVAIATSQRTNVPVIPTSALAFAQSPGASAPGSTPIAGAGGNASQTPGSGVVLVYANGVAVPRPIQTGASDGHLVEVVAGLDVGDRVVTGIAPSGHSLSAVGGG
jgi:HlyD family secretion protein